MFNAFICVLCGWFLRMLLRSVMSALMFDGMGVLNVLRLPFGMCNLSACMMIFTICLYALCVLFSSAVFCSEVSMCCVNCSQFAFL